MYMAGPRITPRPQKAKNGAPSATMEGDEELVWSFSPS